jgi:sodium/potassium-transporting ATPase subunit alpha
MMQIFGNVFATRTALKSLFQRPPWGKKSKNPLIFAAVLTSFILMILVVFVPPINSIFKTRYPPVEFFFIPIGFALLLLTADELRKLAVRRKFLCFYKIAW